MQAHELQGTFEQEVLAASETQPILVDFWATWCGPCRILSPILEKLASQAAGAWKLVTINTETHPDLAAQFGVQAIPTVVLIHRQEPLATFQGALPEDQVVRWLAEHLPGPAASLREDAEAALQADRPQEALLLFRKALAQDPDDHAARLALARLLFRTDPAAAGEAAASIPDHAPEFEGARHVTRLRDLTIWGNTEPPSPQAAPVLRRYWEGACALAEGNVTEASKAWLEVVQTDRKLENDGARKALVSLFDVLGSGHPLVPEARRKLSVLLY